VSTAWITRFSQISSWLLLRGPAVAVFFRNVRPGQQCLSLPTLNEQRVCILVKGARASVGAGLIDPLLGEIQTLGPAYCDVDVDAEDKVRLSARSERNDLSGRIRRCHCIHNIQIVDCVNVACQAFCFFVRSAGGLYLILMFAADYQALLQLPLVYQLTLYFVHSLLFTMNTYWAYLTFQLFSQDCVRRRSPVTRRRSKH
jgi:hypothetical protein